MNAKPEFIPGLKMGELFHSEIVAPVMREAFPHLKYAAALIGPGSEVLGFDDEISTDHDWRPHVFVFVGENDRRQIGDVLEKTLKENIPETFHGFRARSTNEKDLRSQIVFSVGEFWQRTLAFPPDKIPSARDWLTFPEHILLSLTEGSVYKEDAGELTEARNRFSYYPDDVWRYIMAAQWAKISEEEAFMGRCGDAGDEIGSRLVAARLIKELMRLCFQMERRYAPYDKWFGTAFKKLDCARDLLLPMRDVLEQKTWESRQSSLNTVYEAVAEKFNNRKIVGSLAANVSSYYTRSYTVLGASRFAEALRESIQSDEVKNLAPDIGSVNQFVESADVLDHPERCAKLKVLL